MTSVPFSEPDPESDKGRAVNPAERRDGESTFRSFRRAETLMAQRRPLDAVQALLPVLAAAPADASVQLHRAEVAFTRVLESDPADHYARFALGKALQRQGRLTESLAQLRMAWAMDPRPEYQDALGEVNARLAINSDGS